MLKRKHLHFLRLYEPVHACFERFCRVRCYGDMDPGDLMHETLLIAYEKLDNLREEEAFLSFLCGISLRVLSNDHRKKRPETGHDLERMPLISEQRTEHETEKHILYEAMQQLPDVQREAILLYEITGFPIREVAQIQQCTEDAVKQRLKRGRDRLKELLNDFGTPEKTRSHEG